MAAVPQIVNAQNAFFNTGRTKDIAFRTRQLIRLKRAIKKWEPRILEALRQDLGKSAFEGYAAEIAIVYEEIDYMLKRLPALAAPAKVKTSLMQFPAQNTVYHEPYGVALIMSPWNYPFQLTLAPLVAAISAGNCAVVKPSAYSPAVSAVILQLITSVFPEKYVAVVEGGRKVNEMILQEKFDFIFFTGSVAVGRTVMSKAADTLTPVVLELGGKSPCIVDDTADLRRAAKRIVWGKFLNAGQTCVAPDYILVQKKAKKRLVRYMKKYILKFYGKNPISCPDYPKIINEKHFDRLCGLMKSGNILCGGETDRTALKISPVILDGVTWESPVMQEEIFGPVLPVLEFEDIGEVIEAVRERPKPLALYHFTRSGKKEKMIRSSLSFGGGCVNDTIVHLATSYMPFGGVGESGMGSYHGEAGFRTFSHSKSIMKKTGPFEVPLRYPPYKWHLQVLKLLLH